MHRPKQHKSSSLLADGYKRNKPSLVGLHLRPLILAYPLKLTLNLETLAFYLLANTGSTSVPAAESRDRSENKAELTG